MLVFSLRTHSRLLGGEPRPATAATWSVGLATSVLALATVGVAVESEILVHAVEAITRDSTWLTQSFLGLIDGIPLIGNAAEHATAVVVARKGKMDLALQIALGSSTQIALLVAPLLVFVGLVTVPAASGLQMDLVFQPMAVVGLGLATLLAAIVTMANPTASRGCSCWRSTRWWQLRCSSSDECAGATVDGCIAHP